jgi:hypothetical protein
MLQYWAQAQPLRLNAGRSVAMVDEDDVDVLVQTGINNPIAIGLAASLLREAGILFFVMDQNSAAQQENGNCFGWWNVRVPKEREAEAREILQNVEDSK